MPRAAAPLDADGLYQHAVRALARRGRSEFELRRLLRPRMASPAALEAALARLRDHGYLDDGRFAAARAAWEMEVQRHGRARALRDLRARGVAPEVAARAVEAGYRGSREPALLRAWIRKKRLAPPRDPRQAASHFRKLRLAGFSAPACLAALRSWKLDPEWIEAAEAAESAMLEEEPGS